VSARDEVLARVRAATGAQDGPGQIQRDQGRPATADPVPLFVERAGEYRATVGRVPEQGLAGAITEALRERGVARLAVPPDLPEGWVPAGLEQVTDPADVAALDAADGVLTGCALAIAETGTIALDGGPAQGARALTLVPDYHLCVVRADQIVSSVPEAIARLAPAVRERRAPITLISGPSATSDIELRRVEGVHGPRTLHILVAG
jgi:L-lactate dehydrogenase complex protein LldG